MTAAPLRRRRAVALLIGLTALAGLAGCAGNRSDDDTLRVVDVEGDLLGRYWVVRQAESKFVAPPAPREDCGDGFVVLRYVIGRDGQVVTSEIVAAEPPGCYEAAALKLLDTWSFAPTGFNRKRQPVRVTQRIPFTAE